MFDGVAGYMTNFPATQTSAKLDESLAEDIAISLAKVLLDDKANSTITTVTVVPGAALVQEREDGKRVHSATHANTVVLIPRSSEPVQI